MSSPVTAFYAGLLGIAFLYLSILVIKMRRGLKISLGSGDDPHFEGMIRAHANFSEYTPLVLILMLVAELHQANFYALHITGLLILFGRLLHAYGLRNHVGASWQRMYGMLMTFAALLLGSVLSLLTLY